MFFLFHKDNENVISEAIQEDPFIYEPIAQISNLICTCVIHSTDKFKFEIPDQEIVPQLKIINSPYPFCECSLSYFHNEKCIEVSTGFLRVMDCLGAYEETYHDLFRMFPSGVPIDYVINNDFPELIYTLQTLNEYLTLSESGTISNNIFKLKRLSIPALCGCMRFIVGHEFSHYFDPDTDRENRIRHQMEFYKQSLELINILISKNTPFKNLAEELLCYEGDKFRIWSEELLADYEGYLFCISDEEYSVKAHFLGMALAFSGMRILENYNWYTGKFSSFYMPVEFRWLNLSHYICTRIYKKDDWFAFISKEWGIFLLFWLLLGKSSYE